MRPRSGADNACLERSQHVGSCVYTYNDTELNVVSLDHSMSKVSCVYTYNDTELKPPSMMQPSSRIPRALCFTEAKYQTRKESGEDIGSEKRTAEGSAHSSQHLASCPPETLHLAPGTAHAGCLASSPVLCPQAANLGRTEASAAEYSHVGVVTSKPGMY